MIEDATVRNQGPSTMENANEGKMHNDNCMPARSINMHDDFTVLLFYMVEDATVRNQGPSTTEESANEGKMYNDNKCMPAQSINVYDDFTVNSYIFILYYREDYYEAKVKETKLR